MAYRHPDPRRPEMEARWRAEEALRTAQASTGPGRPAAIEAARRELEAAVIACRKSAAKKEKKI
jgi:hypothetical protein